MAARHRCHHLTNPPRHHHRHRHNPLLPLILLLLASAPLRGTEAAGAENCTTYGALHLTADDTEGLRLPSIHLGHEYTVTISMRSTELADGAASHLTPLWQCSDGGLNEAGLYVLRNTSGSSIEFRTGKGGSVERNRLDLDGDAYDLGDGMWHQISVTHNKTSGYSTSGIALYIGTELLWSFSLVTPAVSGSRSDCWVGSSQESGDHTVSVFRGSLRDLHFHEKVLSPAELGTGGVISATSSLCSSGCNGPYSTRSPLRNIAYTAAPVSGSRTTSRGSDDATPAASVATFQGYFTLLSIPSVESGLLLYGGGDGGGGKGCTAQRGGILLYTKPSGDGGASLGVRNTGVSERPVSVPSESVRLTPGAAHYIRVVMSEEAVRLPGGKTVRISLRVKLFVDTRLVANEIRQNYVITPGSVTLLASCHSEPASPSHAVVQLLQSDCGSENPVFPFSERATPSPIESIRQAGAERVWEDPLETLVVPMEGVDSSGSRSYAGWRLGGGGRAAEVGSGGPAAGWGASETPWGVPGNATGVHVFPHTQRIVVTSHRGAVASGDGGLTWVQMTSQDVAYQHSASLPSGLVIAVEASPTSGAPRVARSEDLGETWSSSVLRMSPSFGTPGSFRVFLFGNGMAFITGGEPNVAIWVSEDAGVTWVPDPAASALISEFNPEGCLPHAWSGSADDRGYALMGCGSTLLVRRGAGVWRRAPRTHGMEGIHGVYKIPAFRDPDGLGQGRGAIAVLDANRVVLGWEQQQGDSGASTPQIAWRVAGQAGCTLRSLLRLKVSRVGGGPDAQTTLAVIGDTELLVSTTGGESWEHAGWHPGTASPTGAAVFAPLCTPNSGCSGRGSCLYGLVWPLYPVSCSCRPPYTPPRCSGVLTCLQLEPLLGRDLQCVSNATDAVQAGGVEVAQRPEACTWRREEVRPGVVRWRCAPPLADPHHQVLTPANYKAVRRRKGKKGYPY